MRNKKTSDSLASISESLNKLTQSKADILEKIDARINEINELLQDNLITYSDKISSELKYLFDARYKIVQEIKKDEIKDEIKDYNLVIKYNKISTDKMYRALYNEILSYFENRKYKNKKELYGIFKDTETMNAMFDDLNLGKSLESIKMYQKALNDVYSIYKYQISEEEKAQKQRKKDKLINDALFIGFFSGMTRLSKSARKKRR